MGCAAAHHQGAADADLKESFPDEVRKAYPHAARREAHCGRAVAPADAARMALQGAAQHEQAEAESESRAEAEVTLRSAAVEWARRAVQVQEPQGAAAPEARAERAQRAPQAWATEQTEPKK